MGLIELPPHPMYIDRNTTDMKEVYESSYYRHINAADSAYIELDAQRRHYAVIQPAERTPPPVGLDARRDIIQ